MASQPSPRRRFQFRLRTLMIGVTMFCIVCGWLLSQAAIAWQRETMLEDAHASWVDTGDDTAGVSWLRRAMGDQVMALIVLDMAATDEQLEHFRAVFPEACVYRSEPSDHHRYIFSHRRS